MKGIAKKTGIGIQFTWSLVDRRGTEQYREFSTSFKNRKLSIFKVKFYAWIALA